METTSFNIPTVSCSSCSEKLKNELGTIKGVENVSANLKTQMVTIEYDSSSTGPNEIKEKIISLGYDAS